MSSGGGYMGDGIRPSGVSGVRGGDEPVRNNHALPGGITTGHYNVDDPPVDAPGITNVPGAVRRPMSFVKALEMSDRYAVGGSAGGAPPRGIGGAQRGVGPRAGQRGGPVGLQADVSMVEEEGTMYGSSYEIAV